MSDDGPVPAVDTRATEDPLLCEVAEIGRDLNAISRWTSDWLNPEKSNRDPATLVEFRDKFDSNRIGILNEIKRLWDRFQPEADGVSAYNSELCDYLVWHLGEAARLIISETEATNDQRQEFVKQLEEVADKIKLAATNPTGLYLVPKLSGYEQHELKRELTELRKKKAELERRKYEWPAYQYDLNCPPVYQRPVTYADLAGFKAQLREESARESHGAGGDEPKAVREIDYLDYVSAADIRTQHTPDGIVLDHRDLKAFLKVHSNIRTARPPGKDGKPRENRLIVHLADWHKNREALVEWYESDSDAIETPSEAEVERRQKAVRSRKQRGK